MLKYHLFIQRYKTLKGKPKLKKQSTFLQSVKCDSIDLDWFASLEYEIGREKQELEFFVLSEINRNIILCRDWLKQFGSYTYYDLGCFIH